MKIMYDIRCNHLTGIFNYGIGLLRKLDKLLNASTTLIVVCYKTQLPYLPKDLSNRTWFFETTSQLNDIIKCADIHELITKESISKYVSPNYQIECGLPIPFAFGIHDLIKYNNSYFFCNTDELIRRHGKSYVRFICKCLDANIKQDDLEFRFFRFNMRMNASKAAYILTNSNDTKKIVAEEFLKPEDRILVYRPEVKAVFSRQNVQNFTPVSDLIDSRKVSPFCVYVGLTHPHKRTSMILQAFYEIQDFIPNESKLVMVAKKSAVQRLLSNYSESFCNRVICLERISDEKMAFLYAHALALVNASTLEGYGIPVAEALTCGCPVIASDLSVFKEEFGDSIEYFQKDDVAELKSLMRKAYATGLDKPNWTQTIFDEDVLRLVNWCDQR